ncbi:MAG TPA: MMPL family transporter [Thermotogota bacterium]|nr:MMPL family transporter [Thermotogota bacterium]HPJ88698.1 MMPL family transporter [Thermotogota bacterium]HPR95953.1 MMPL family transporter [Thermotogota bacterium]
MEFIGKLVQRFWKEILIVSIFLTVFLAYQGSKISLNTDLMTLLPSDDEYSQQYQELFSGEAVSDTVVVVVDFDGNQNKALEFATELKSILCKKVDMVKYFKNLSSTSMMGTTGLLLTNSSIFEQLVSTMNFTKFLVDNPAALDFSIVRNVGDSLMQVEKVFDDMADIDSADKFVTFSPDNEIFIINIVLTKPSINLDFTKMALTEIRRELDELCGEYGYTYGITGSYQQALDTNNVISHDLTITTIITLTAISALFFIVYGNICTTISIFMTLVMGICWSLGIFQFIFTNLDFISSFVLALLLGLGIDFGIHLSHRISEELKENSEEFNNGDKEIKRNFAKLAVVSAVKHSGKNTLIGGITTIAAFVSMVFVDSPALQKVSLMSGIGISIFLLVMIIILPSFLIFFSKFMRIKNTQQASWVQRKFSNLFNIYDKKISKYVVILLFCLSVPLILFTYFSFRDFNYTPAQVIPTEIESVQMLNKITDHKILSNVDNSIITYIDDPEKLYEAENNIYERIPDLGNLNSLASFIPKEMFDNFGSFKMEIENILGNSQNAFTLILFKKLGVYGDLDYLYKLFRESPNFSIFIKEIFKSEILPNEAKQYLTTTVNGKMVYTIYAQPKYDIWANNNLKRFVEGLNNTGHDFYGYPIIYYKVMKQVIQSIIFAVLLAIVIIAFTVFISLKKFSDSMTVLLDLGLTIICLFGFYYLFGMRLNFLTLMAFPLLIGMAIDAPIHLIGRLREEEASQKSPDYINNVLMKTGKAISLSSATTAIAFATFLLASSPILGEFGLIMTMGIMFNWFITFFWLKKFRDLIQKRENKEVKNEDQAE